MPELLLISQIGGVRAAKQLNIELQAMNLSKSTVIHCNGSGVSFTHPELCAAIAKASFDFWDGIVLGSFGGSSRLILSNKHGYLGYYWGFRSFRPIKIDSIDHLNWLKSQFLNEGGKMNWSSFQFVLNNFYWLQDADTDNSGAE